MMTVTSDALWRRITQALPTHLVSLLSLLPRAVGSRDSPLLPRLETLPLLLPPRSRTHARAPSLSPCAPSPAPTPACAPPLDTAIACAASAPPGPPALGPTLRDLDRSIEWSLSPTIRSRALYRRRQRMGKAGKHEGVSPMHASFESWGFRRQGVWQNVAQTHIAKTVGKHSNIRAHHTCSHPACAKRGQALT